jgi:CTP:molybdopterin cytidylyltransferase MocA
VSAIAGVLLAAGGSQRLGEPKQLLQRDGLPLVRHVYQQLAAAGLSRLAVVLGCQRERVAAALPEACEGLHNPEWREGIAASIRCAAGWAGRVEGEALLIAVCDQPRLTSEHVLMLCAAYRERGQTCASGYAGKRGVPALFAPDWLPRLLELQGDEGAGSLLRATSDLQVVNWSAGAEDIDSRADAERLGWHTSDT